MKLLNEYRGLIPVSLARMGNLVVGFALIFIVSSLFSSVEQGVYYTFASLVGAQYFFDLGVGFILANIAGRQASQHSEEMGQSTSKVPAEIMRFACIWGGIAGCAMLILIGGAGLYLFQANPVDIPDIEVIWISFCLLSCVLLVYNMLTRLYEGLGHVQLMAYLRLLLTAINVSLIFVFAALGMGLAALPIALLIALIMTCGFAIFRSKDIRESFSNLRQVSKAEFSWKKDIWPFQRGVAITWLAGYVIFQAQIPILFVYAGPEAAGRFGMCVQIFQAINSTANIFLTYSIRGWTDMAVREKSKEMRKSFWRVNAITMLTTLLGCGVVLIGFAMLNEFDHKIADRISPLSVLVLYATAVVFNQFYFAISYYFRAFGREAVWQLTLLGAVFILCAALYFQNDFTEWTAVMSFFGVSIFILCGGSLIQAYRNGLMSKR